MEDERESTVERIRKRRKPATTPEGRENQLISSAFDLADERIRTGVASAMEIVHFLKLGSSRERLEQDRLRHENALTQAKIEAIESQARIEELYLEAMEAFRGYAGGINERRDQIED